MRLQMLSVCDPFRGMGQRETQSSTQALSSLSVRTGTISFTSNHIRVTMLCVPLVVATDKQGA